MNDGNEAYEDYIKSIYEISKKKKGGWVNNSEIANHLSIKPSSVTNMLYKLKNQGYISWNPRKALRLTSKGRKVAVDILKSYNELTRFFRNVLDISDSTKVSSLSCLIEHHLTPSLVEALEDLNSNYC